jgi:hypothetical protein
MFTESFFQLLADPSEKVRILMDLVKSGVRVQIKRADQDSEMILADTISFRGSGLRIKPSAGAMTEWTGVRSLILQFLVGEQKFICQVNVENENSILVLGMEAKLYRVQRRDFFRLRLPPHFRGVLALQKETGDTTQPNLQLVDLGGGGCRVDVSNVARTFEARSKFSADLKIPGRDPLPVSCEVRYLQKVNLRPPVITMGIQFVNLQEAQKSRLAAIVMDLYREHFVRI